ncbi:TPA: hypothetical protein DCW38_02445 [candidate division WOR-3 bacterium]|uniref:histidine kinase n=1 Tax=candidate division WOR-3 bacterium TaxID=2052148 RepID=A0A350H907_UNCW3|nr:hypothetical protein [candidate division WOR-3 bacterium]
MRRESRPKSSQFTCIPQGESYVLIRNILRYANRGLYVCEFLDTVSRELFDFTLCDGIEIFTLGDSISYNWSIDREKMNEPHFKRFDSEDSVEGKVKLACGKSMHELCEIVLKKKRTKGKKYFTKLGNLYIPDAGHAVEIDILYEKEWKKRVFKLETEYKSILMIHFEIDETNTSLIQLKSKKKNFFNPMEIEFYEGLMNTMGIAISDRRAQYCLRERMKELTCLYEISKILQEPKVSIEESSERMIDLIIEAFQFPDIVMVRLEIDGKIYTSREFKVTPDKIFSDIITENAKRGILEVFHKAPFYKKDEVFFLDEEQTLINAITRQIALILEKEKIEEDKETLHHQLLHADRLATIGQLVAGVAHELNEPLSSILGFSQLIKKNENLAVQTREDNEKIVKSALHAREIIKKLMFFAKRMPPQMIPVDLNDIVKETIYFLESHLIKSAIELQMKLSPEIPKVIADPSQLYQVLVNLVVNAIQSMDRGGILKIETIPSGEFVRLSVEDNGYGMSEDVVGKIFIPFFTTKKDGTGLGLSVVHGIVESHGGKIEVKSIEKKGTVFSVMLPAEKSEENKNA